MKATEGKTGRIFILRLDDGDIVPGCIEQFARENNISAAQVIIVGGIGSGEVVVGPRETDKMPPMPMMVPVDGAHEIAAVGLLAPDEKGKPVLHIHGAMGRSGQTLTGCLRPGVKTWLVAEVIIFELLDVKVVRRYDEKSGFTLLQI
jgi:predicted DNA-binding protein with PD1-like motif